MKCECILVMSAVVEAPLYWPERFVKFKSSSGKGKKVLCCSFN